MRSSSKRVCSFLVPVALVALFCLVPLAAASAQQPQSTGEAAGIVFQTLSPQDLDTLKEKTGYRLGVGVIEVKPGSPGAAAGIKPRDVIFAIGKTGVDSAEGAVAAIKAASGAVELAAITLVNDSYTPKTYSLDLGGGTPGGGVVAPPAGVGWQLQALPKEQLDQIEKSFGYRVGVAIVQVAPGSPADKAGVKAGDILLVVAKTGVDSPEKVQQVLAGQSGSVEILAMRNVGDKFEAVNCTIVLGAGGGTAVVAPSTGPGWKLEPLPKEALDQIEKSLGRRVGVAITEVAPGSPADKAGIKAGDILMFIAKTGVDSPQAADQILAGQSGSVEILLMRRTGDKWDAVQCTMVLGPGGGGVIAPPAGVGWQLQALSKEDLDEIEKSSGYRVGVSIVQVTSGSPADKAGLKAGDILLVVAKTPVDSSEKVEQALAGQSGSVEILAMRRAGDKFEPLQCTIVLAGGAGTTGPTGPMPPVSDDPVTAYFDMMDFIRTQAWGRTVSTSAAERQRVAVLLQQSLPQLDQQAQMAIAQIPQAWAAVQQAWAGLSEDKKAEQREYWRKYLLSPGQLLPPPEAAETFRSEGDQIVFNYPVRWIVAQTQSGQTSLLYLGPPGTSGETTWEQIIDPTKSPPGALLALAPQDQELQASGSYLAAARIIARNFVTGNAPDMKEINALPLGNQGAIITLLGRLPGQREDWFFWVGCIRFGEGQVVAGRMGGPVSQVDTLVPAFNNILVTLQLHPPGAQMSESGSDLAISIIQNSASNYSANLMSH